MRGNERDAASVLGSSRDALDLAPDPAEEAFDWVAYKCECPNCGAEVTEFKTKDLCRQLDTIDYRTAYHFYAACNCGTWIDFIRKPATDIRDFDMHVEQL